RRGVGLRLGQPHPNRCFGIGQADRQVGLGRHEDPSVLMMADALTGAVATSAPPPTPRNLSSDLGGAPNTPAAAPPRGAATGEARELTVRRRRRRGSVLLVSVLPVLVAAQAVDRALHRVAGFLEFVLGAGLGLLGLALRFGLLVAGDLAQAFLGLP